MMQAALSPSLKQQLPRLVIGLLLAGALTACLVLGGPYLAVALALVSALALYEFFQMFWPGKTKICSKAFGIFAGMAIFCPVGQPWSLGVILVLVFVWAAMVFLVDYGRGNNAARLADQMPLVLGVVYIPVLLHLALGLSMKEQFLVAAAAIASDTAAYYVGCAWGKHKIWPRVSPKKSWEGSIAGLAATVLVVVLMGALFGEGGFTAAGILFWAGTGALLNIAAQLGDFFESALKRTHGIKDSSAILPGHGGILDRIDSVLFALAAYSAIALASKHASAIGNLLSAA